VHHYRSRSNLFYGSSCSGCALKASTQRVVDTRCIMQLLRWQIALQLWPPFFLRRCKQGPDFQNGPACCVPA
jgi:hypothetical protein